MIRTTSAVLLSGVLLVATALPQSVHAHGSDAVVAFAAGATLGYLLTEAQYDHDDYRGYPPRAYVAAPPPVVWYPAPVRYVRYVEVAPPPYYGYRPVPPRVWVPGRYVRRHR